MPSRRGGAGHFALYFLPKCNRIGRFMDSQINGFTGFGRHNPGFVSAKDAIRKAEIAAQAAKNDPVQQARQTLAQAQAFTSGLGSGADDANAHRGSAHRSAALKFAAPVSSRDSGLTFDPEKLARIPEADRRWAWVEVDLSAIRHNTQAVRNRLAHGVRLMAVVKADAYGHGAVPVAKMALNSGADYLGVATVDEAIEPAGSADRRAHLGTVATAGRGHSAAFGLQGDAGYLHCRLCHRLR